MSYPIPPGYWNPQGVNYIPPMPPLEPMGPLPGAYQTPKKQRTARSSKTQTVTKRKGEPLEVRIARGNRIQYKSKYKKKGTSKRRTLKKRVDDLEKFKTNFSKKIFRELTYTKHSCNDNECAYTQFSAVTSLNLEGSVDNLRFLDRSVGDDVEVSMINASAAIKRNIVFRDIYCAVRARNNYSIPCELTFYWFLTTENTDVSISSKITTSGTNLNISSPLTDLNVYPSDLDVLKRSYKILRTEKVTLNAGDQAESKYTRHMKKYDPTYLDNLPASEDANVKGDINCVIRIQGVLAHDTTTSSNVGRADASCDLEFYRKWSVVYPSDARFMEFETTNNGSAIVGEVAGPNVVNIVEDA